MALRKIMQVRNTAITPLWTGATSRKSGRECGLHERLDRAEDAGRPRLTAELQARTVDLNKAAASGNLARIKVAFEQPREVCNACHKEFRKK